MLGMQLSDALLNIGIFLFACVGALKARSYGMDFVGGIILAFLNGYGGGTVRDFLIGIHPVGWTNSPAAFLMVVAAVLLIALFRNIERYIKHINFTLDTLAIGLFTVLGIDLALAHSIIPFYSLVLGVITATFGGLIADVLSNKVPSLLVPGELYATACLSGGVAYLGLLHAGLDKQLCLLVAVSVVTVIRIISYKGFIRTHPSVNR